MLGDGDFSFARSLSQLGVCCSITATTKDNQERLFDSFDSARGNVEVIMSHGHQVLYNVDATKIQETIMTSSLHRNDQHNGSSGNGDDDDDRDSGCGDPPMSKYDVVLWNFPHKVGKQNIKHNR